MTTLNLPRPFGPYTLLRRLAAGGMAEVYLGRTSGAAGFEKLVAIKRVHPHHSADESFGSMLLDEAKLSVSLSHRNIVQTLDLGCVDGAYVLVMEHVEGYDAQRLLAALRQAGRVLPVDLAAHIAAAVVTIFERSQVDPRKLGVQQVDFLLAGYCGIGNRGIGDCEGRILVRTMATDAEIVGVRE